MESSLSPPRFLVLEEAVEAGALSIIDLEFAKMLFEHTPEQDERMAALVCHLTKSSREGHICVQFRDGQLFPSPHEVWLRDCSSELSLHLLHLLDQLPSVFYSLPSSILSDVDPLALSYPDQPICRFNDFLYLQKNWVFETHSLHHLRILLKGAPELAVEGNDLQAKLVGYPLNEKQGKAVEAAFKNRLSMISGGPGTGKTHTAGCIVSLFVEMFSDFEIKIAVTAPTGKAASKLRASLGRADCVDIESLTLHSLLDLSPESPYQYPPRKVLPYDLIIVDECSMIDAKLMACFLPAVKEGARVVFLGDPDQLPSVEGGAVFADMIDLLDDAVVVHLDTCLRVELQELVAFGKEINQGAVSQYPKCVDQIKPVSENGSQREKELLEEIIKHFPSSFTVSGTGSGFEQFRVLSPLRSGLFGVDQLNSKCLQVVQRQIPEGVEYALPIMITRNDLKRGLFNGETGLLVRRSKGGAFDLEEGDYAFFGERKIPADLLPSFEYAFCMSVHKSQGSEFDHVFLVLPKGSEWFGKEMLYTAVTRAKKRLTIWGDEAVMRGALGRECIRHSGVIERMGSYADG